MAYLHMDTDDVNDLANRLARAANEIVDTANALKRSANRLDARWSGGRSDFVIRQIHAAARSAEYAANDANRLGRRVRAEVDEWLEADRTGAGRVLGAVAPLPAPVPVRSPGIGNNQDGVMPLPGTVPARPPGDGWGWEPGPKTEWAIGRFIAGLAIKTVVSSAKINLWVAPILNIISQRFLVPDNPDRDELWNRTARLVDAMVTLYLYGSLGIIGFEIGALIGGTGGAIAGPGGIAIGATTIGAAAGSFLAGLVVDAYLKSDLRTKLIDAVVDFIRTQSNPSKPYIDPYIRQGVMA